MQDVCWFQTLFPKTQTNTLTEQISLQEAYFYVRFATSLKSLARSQLLEHWICKCLSTVFSGFNQQTRAEFPQKREMGSIYFQQVCVVFPISICLITSVWACVANRIFSTYSLYAKYYFALRSIVEKHDFRRRYNRMVGMVDSVAQSEALKIQRRSEQVKEEALLQISRSM